MFGGETGGILVGASNSRRAFHERGCPEAQVMRSCFPSCGRSPSVQNSRLANLSAGAPQALSDGGGVGETICKPNPRVSRALPMAERAAVYAVLRWQLATGLDADQHESSTIFAFASRPRGAVSSDSRAASAASPSPMSSSRRLRARRGRLVGGQRPRAPPRPQSLEQFLLLLALRLEVRVVEVEADARREER